jgi:predicted aspartyl protease
MTRARATAVVNGEDFIRRDLRFSHIHIMACKPLTFIQIGWTKQMSRTPPMNIMLSYVAILCAVLGFSTSAPTAAEVVPVNISGAWKIDTQNGPVPVCGFRQAGNNLTGSCAGPIAVGTITGTIIGRQVRWRWQWVAYAGVNAAAFEFVGTLQPDNTITGTVERGEIGFSRNFTAKRGFVAAGQTRQGWDSFCNSTEYVDANGVTRLNYAHDGCEYGPPRHLAAPTSQAPNQTAVLQVPLQRQGGTYVVPVLINNAITLNFVVDSGAADMSVPADVFSTLARTGTIRDTDIIGEQTYVLADGSKITFTIRSLKVGDRVVENVSGSIAPSQGSLLLGQSFLERFKSWSVDNTKHVLLLEPN